MQYLSQCQLGNALVDLCIQVTGKISDRVKCAGALKLGRMRPVHGCRETARWLAPRQYVLPDLFDNLLELGIRRYEYFGAGVELRVAADVGGIRVLGTGIGLGRGGARSLAGGCHGCWLTVQESEKRWALCSGSGWKVCGVRVCV